MRDNQDELCIYGKGDVPYVDDGEYERVIDGDEQNRMRVSLASDKWKHDAGDALEALLKGVMDTPQGRHIVGIQIACGVYGEWHQWGFSYEPDYGKPMTEYFRAYLRDTYGSDENLQTAWNNPDVSIESAALAPPSVRDGDSEKVYRVPNECAWAVDSLKALQKCIPDAVICFAERIRDVWDRKILVGTFYSYYDGWSKIYIGGHLEPGRLYESGLIDYICAPFRYNGEIRGISGSSCARGLIESARLNGVVWLTEMDNPPIGSPQCVGGIPERRKESVALMKRHVLEPFTRGMGTWFYDHRLVLDLGYNTSIYIKKGWWDHPELLKIVNNIRQIAEHTARTPFVPEADVLCVFDAESRYYSNASDVFAYGNSALIFNTIGKSGAVYDSIYFDDLYKADLTRYKCIVFVHVPYLDEKRREFIRNQAAKDGRYLIWINTSGYICDTSASDENISEVSEITVREVSGVPSDVRISYEGREYETSAIEPYSLNFSPAGNADIIGYFSETDIPAAAELKFPDHDSFYFSVFPSDSGLLRSIFKKAGVFIYSEGGEALLAGNGIITVCTDRDRSIRICLKNGKEIAENLTALTTAVYDEITGDRLDIPEDQEE